MMHHMRAPFAPMAGMLQRFMWIVAVVALLAIWLVYDLGWGFYRRAGQHARRMSQRHREPK
jgi:hypothetical protein